MPPALIQTHSHHARLRHELLELVNRNNDATTITPTMTNPLYTPTPVPISALLLPPSIPLNTHAPEKSALSGWEISFVVCASLLGIVICLLINSLLQYRMQSKEVNENENEKGSKIMIPKIVISDSYDDSTWGTPITTHTSRLPLPHSFSAPPGLEYSSKKVVSESFIRGQESAFEQRVMNEESDIALALDRALCESSAYESFDASSVDTEIELAMLTAKISVDRRVNRSVAAGIFERALKRSSNSTAASFTGSESEEAHAVVVRRAHAKSLQIKPAWCTNVPQVIVSEPAQPPLGLNERRNDSDVNLLQPIPYLMVTHPSLASLNSSGSRSTISIDLADFPLPDIEEAVEVDKEKSWDSDAVKRRSTVDQFITMYRQ